MCDPIKNYYEKGYLDAKNKKKSRVPHNFKCAYSSGRYDYVTGKPNRYEKLNRA